MNLPDEFINRMKKLLNNEAENFLDTYNQPKSYGLRMNPLKYSGGFSINSLPFTLTPVPWAREGYYAEASEHPGKHPLHEGGAYYIQEPSAMSAASLLAPEPGDTVCDLCAAPGGKSTQIAGRLCGMGLLVSNEIFSSRAKILSQNIERLGIGNCVVCSEPPDRIAGHFPLFFDKVLVDAPCSGEGMFRKDETAISEWSPAQVITCSERQKMILSYCDKILKPGGIMVYSTCTFSPEENEQMIVWFLDTHPDYELEYWGNLLPKNCGLEGGRSDFLPESHRIKSEIEYTLRLWPHKVRGEGHFAARLRKKDAALPQNTPEKIPVKNGRQPLTKNKSQERKPDISGFLSLHEHLIAACPDDNSYSVRTVLSSSDNYQYFGDELYLIPALMNSLQGLKIVRPGLHLGTRRKNRFEPAHALAKALQPKDVRQHMECTMDEAIRYLKGETIPCPPDLKSWTLMCYQGISLGWGKASNGTLKNHYPKGLRIH